MQVTKMRPTFTVDLPVPAYEATKLIRQAIQTCDPAGLSDSAGRCVELSVDKREYHLWSPYLSIQIEEAGESSWLRGRFSPRAEIWTLLMFLYFMTGSLVFFAAIFGYAQWSIGLRPWGLIVAGGGFLVIASLHVASLIGQTRARAQMDQLKSRLDKVLNHAFSGDAVDGDETA